jgi:hypothetical protein
MEHGPMITSSRSSSPALHDLADGARVPEISVSTGVPAIGKEADQVLGRRQRRDVADALVVGLAGLFRQRQPLVVVGGGCKGLGAHDGLSGQVLRTRKNRRGCRRLVWVRGLRLSYAFASPAAERCENQKYVKKNDAVRMGRECSTRPLAARLTALGVAIQ